MKTKPFCGVKIALPLVGDICEKTWTISLTGAFICRKKAILYIKVKIVGTQTIFVILFWLCATYARNVVIWDFSSLSRHTLRDHCSIGREPIVVFLRPFIS